MLLSECLDAGTASRRVSYGSASQFNREYRRFFPAPPVQDIKRFCAASLHNTKLGSRLAVTRSRARGKHPCANSPARQLPSGKG